MTQKEKRVLTKSIIRFLLIFNLLTLIGRVTSVEEVSCKDMTGTIKYVLDTSTVEKINSEDDLYVIVDVEGEEVVVRGHLVWLLSTGNEGRQMEIRKRIVRNFFGKENTVYEYRRLLKES